MIVTQIAMYIVMHIGGGGGGERGILGKVIIYFRHSDGDGTLIRRNTVILF